MTNQDPNQTEESDETAVVPQTRTLAQWVQQCKDFMDGADNASPDSTQILSHELRWDQGHLFMFECLIYDPAVHDMNYLKMCFMGILLTIDDVIIGAQLVNSFTNILLTAS